jgi:hypothetical protein
MLVILCVAVRVWLPNILDCARYHADLSYTIEWGPTYWVEEWMRDLGRPGIKLLCNTRVNAPRHVLIGTSKAFWNFHDPAYFDLFAEAYANPSSPVRGDLLQVICAMYGASQSASPNKVKISEFLEQVFDSKATPDPERQMAMAALWAGNVDKLTVLTDDRNPASAEFALLKLAEAQPEKYIHHNNPAVAGRAVFLLAETQPERHLATFAAFLGDITKPDELRETLAEEWCRKYYRDHLRPADAPLRLEELFAPALTACRSDGTPHNPVRVSIWDWLYWLTGKGAPITLANSQETSRWLHSMRETVRSSWDSRNCGKGIPYPPESDAIETVRKCVTVPLTDEAGDNMLDRSANEFLGRETVFLPFRPRVLREAPAVQQKMKAFGLPDKTVAEILSSDNEEAIRKLIPFLVESQYFALPTDMQKAANRLKDGKALANLAKIGPAAVPVLLQCYQADAFDSLSLLNALVVCDPSFQSVLAWGEGVKTDVFFKFYTPAVLKSLPVYLLAYDVPRGAALILKGLADESPSGARLFPVRGRDGLDRTNFFFINKPYFKIPYRNCDRLREAMEESMDFIPRVQGDIPSVTERDQAMDHLRTWVSAESKPGGILTRVCWFRTLLVDRDGKPFVAEGETEFIVFNNGGSTSNFSMPCWLPFLPTTNQPSPQVKVLFKEKSQGARYEFLAPIDTHFSPGLHTLGLRLTESK